MTVPRSRDARARGTVLAIVGLLLPILSLDHVLWTGSPGRTWLALALGSVEAAAFARSTRP